MAFVLLTVAIGVPALAQTDPTQMSQKELIEYLTQLKRDNIQSTIQDQTDSTIAGPLGNIDYSSLIKESLSSQTVNPEANIILKPPYPQPGETVTASLDDYSSAFFGATITWLLNDQEIPAAKNQREVSFTAGTVGKTEAITAVLTSPDGVQKSFQSLLTPVYLDIILEPQTRVPDFYQGRSLPSHDSSVLATALVYNGDFIDPARLVYSWKINRQAIEGGLVRHRNKVVFTMPRGESAVLTVEVGLAGGGTIASRSIFVPSVYPKLLFYEANPLFGISQLVLGDKQRLSGPSLTVQAEPYYLDSGVYNNPDVTEWKIDRRAVGNQSANPYLISLQRSGLNGISTIEFHVRSLEQISQGAKDSAQISF